MAVATGLLLPILLSGYSVEGKTTAGGDIYEARVRGLGSVSNVLMNGHYLAPIHLWQIEIDAGFHLGFISSFRFRRPLRAL